MVASCEKQGNKSIMLHGHVFRYFSFETVGFELNTRQSMKKGRLRMSSVSGRQVLQPASKTQESTALFDKKIRKHLAV